MPFKWVVIANSRHCFIFLNSFSPLFFVDGVSYRVRKQNSNNKIIETPGDVSDTSLTLGHFRGVGPL